MGSRGAFLTLYVSLDSSAHICMHILNHFVEQHSRSYKGMVSHVVFHSKEKKTTAAPLTGHPLEGRQEEGALQLRNCTSGQQPLYHTAMEGKHSQFIIWYCILQGHAYVELVFRCTDTIQYSCIFHDAILTC